MSDVTTESSEGETSESETLDAPLLVDNPALETSLFNKALSANHSADKAIILDRAESKLLIQLLNANRPQKDLFECTHRGCNRVYTSRRARDQHKRDSHSGGNFRCREPGCNKEFTTNRSRDRHEKSHTVRFNCDQCTQTFTLKQSLKRHIASQHPPAGSVRLECPNDGCSVTFASGRKDNLKKHVAVCNKKTVAERRGKKRKRDNDRPGYRKNLCFVFCMRTLLHKILDDFKIILATVVAMPPMRVSRFGNAFFMLRNITTPIKRKRQMTKQSDEMSVEALSQKYHRTKRQVKRYIADVTIGKWDLVPGWKRGMTKSNNASVAMEWLKRGNRIENCIKNCTEVLQTKLPHWYLVEQIQQELVDNNIAFVSHGALDIALRRYTKTHPNVPPSFLSFTNVLMS